MRTAWKAMLAFGIAMILYALTMDTTVGYGANRVHNIGLQQNQQIILILGCLAFLSGIILLAVSHLRPREPDIPQKAKPETPGWVTRALALARARRSFIANDRPGLRTSAATVAAFAFGSVGWILGASLLDDRASGPGVGGTIGLLGTLIATFAYALRCRPSKPLLTRMLTATIGLCVLFGAPILHSQMEVTIVYFVIGALAVGLLMRARSKRAPSPDSGR